MLIAVAAVTLGAELHVIGSGVGGVVSADALVIPTSSMNHPG